MQTRLVKAGRKQKPDVSDPNFKFLHADCLPENLIYCHLYWALSDQKTFSAQGNYLGTWNINQINRGSLMKISLGTKIDQEGC